MNVGELMLGKGLRSIESLIGVQFQDSFHIESTCLEGLESLKKRLKEDQSSKNFQIQVLEYGMFKNCLAPLLLRLEDEGLEIEDDFDEIFSQTVEILSLITEPFNCNGSANNHTMYQPYNHHHDNRLNSFASKIFKNIVEEFLSCGIMKIIMRKVQDVITTNVWSTREINIVDHALFLTRNLLYNSAETDISPDQRGGGGGKTERSCDQSQGEEPPGVITDYQHVHLLGVLFEHGLQDIVIFCTNSKHKEKWTLSLIQLITMVYKNSETHLKCKTFLLNEEEIGLKYDGYRDVWDENQCGSQCVKSRGNDVDIDIISTLASVDADCCSTIIGREFQQKDVIDDVELKDETEVIDERDDNGNKSSQMDVTENCIKSQSVQTSEEEMKNALLIIIVREKVRAFTLELLKNGWAQLLYDVKHVLVTTSNCELAPVYYLWNVGFCLMMAERHCLDFIHVRDIVSPYIIDYLVFKAVQNAETFLAQTTGKNVQNDSEVHDLVNEIELSVVGIKYMFDTLDFYWLSEYTDKEEHYQLLQTQCMFAQSGDLRQLFVLLFHLYNPKTFSTRLLINLISVNHNYMKMAKRLKLIDEKYTFFDARSHLLNFADKDILLKYNLILDNYHDCPLSAVEKAVNMIHCVAKDLKQHDVLLQLPILNAISAVDDDLILARKLPQTFHEVVDILFENFLGKVEDKPLELAETLAESLQENFDLLHGKNAYVPETKTSSNKDVNDQDMGSLVEWSEEEIEELNQVALQYEDSTNLLQDIMAYLNDIGYDRSSIEVLEQMKRLGYHDNTNTQHTPNKKNSTIDEVILKLKDDGKHNYLQWIQNVLLQTVYVKLGGTSLGKLFVEEPVIMISLALNKPVPLVAYTKLHHLALKDEDFQELLTKLNLEKPTNQNEQFYHRIPNTWSVRDLMKKAAMCNKITFENLMFTEEDVKNYYKKHEDHFSEISHKGNRKSIRCLKHSGPTPTPELWTFYTKKARCSDTSSKNFQVPWWEKNSK